MLVGLAMQDELVGDYNGDGEVGASDLGLVLPAWGTTNYGAMWIQQIPDGTNVGAEELSGVLQNWGCPNAANCQFVGSAPAVPEPAGLGVLALLAMLGFARRRS